MITQVTQHTLPQYITYLRSLIKKEKKIYISEWVEEDDDTTIDFSGSMEACIADLRQRMYHGSQKT